MTPHRPGGHDGPIRRALLLPLAALVLVGPPAASPPRAPLPLAAVPLALEQRDGGFVARGDGYSALLRPTGQLVALSAGDKRAIHRRPPRTAGFGVSLVGARAVSPRPTDRLAPLTVFGRGTFATFGRVTYHGLYPQIDLAYHGAGSRLQGDWLVAPNGDPQRIRLRVSGATVAPAADGAVRLSARGLHAFLSRPLASQGARRVPAAWRIEGRTLSFSLGAYDRTRPLLVDPQLESTVTLGGDMIDSFLDVDADTAGNLVAVGTTLDLGFPHVGGGPFQPRGGYEGVVATLSPDLKVLGTTILGGTGDDTFTRVVADAPGEWTVSGMTTSGDFPLPHGVDQVAGGGTCAGQPCLDGLLLEFRSGFLRFGTLVGGSRDDVITSLAVDRSARGGAGLIAFGGVTSSPELIRSTGADDFVGSIDFDALESLQPGASYRLQVYGGRGNDTVTAVGIHGDTIWAVGGGRSATQVTPGAVAQFEQAFALVSSDDGRTWREQDYPTTGTYAELDSVNVDADGSAYVGFTGYFPGGDYGSCVFGKCQPLGFVKLDPSTLAATTMSVVVPPLGGVLTLLDVDAARSADGHITRLGAAIARYPSFASTAPPTAEALLLDPQLHADDPVVLPNGTLASGAAFDGDALYLAGEAPEGAFPNVAGDADAFMSRIGGITTTACQCASIAVRARAATAARRRLSLTLDWTMTCTGGTGTCEGAVAVAPPRGGAVAPTVIRCGPGPCGTQHGTTRVRVTTAAATRRASLVVHRWCIVDGVRKALPDTRLTVVAK